MSKTTVVENTVFLGLKPHIAEIAPIDSRCLIGRLRGGAVGRRTLQRRDVGQYLSQFPRSHVGLSGVRVFTFTLSGEGKMVHKRKYRQTLHYFQFRTKP